MFTPPTHLYALPPPRAPQLLCALTKPEQMLGRHPHPQSRSNANIPLHLSINYCADFDFIFYAKLTLTHACGGNAAARRPRMLLAATREAIAHPNAPLTAGPIAPLRECRARSTLVMCAAHTQIHFQLSGVCGAIIKTTPIRIKYAFRFETLAVTAHARARDLP